MFRINAVNYKIAKYNHIFNANLKIFHMRDKALKFITEFFV